MKLIKLIALLYLIEFSLCFSYRTYDQVLTGGVTNESTPPINISKEKEETNQELIKNFNIQNAEIKKTLELKNPEYFESKKSEADNKIENKLNEITDAFKQAFLTKMKSYFDSNETEKSEVPSKNDKMLRIKSSGAKSKVEENFTESSVDSNKGNKYQYSNF